MMIFRKINDIRNKKHDANRRISDGLLKSEFKLKIDLINA